MRVCDEDGNDVAPGAPGELVIGGPQVVPGYWGNPQETELAFVGGAMRTGDIGVLDRDGWTFIVDRKKALINASGYKVWPREVEDGLLAHPAVREAAVVGVPDAYRDESVKAYVSLRPGAGQNRRLTLEALSGASRTAGDVAKKTGLGRPTVSTTLTKLVSDGAAVKAKRGHRAV